MGGRGGGGKKKGGGRRIGKARTKRSHSRKQESQKSGYNSLPEA